MCAKVSSKKSVRTVVASPAAAASRTPRRNNRKTPTKTQPKGKASKQQNRSTRGSGDQSDNQSDNQADDDDENSSKDSIDEDEIDFLGRPPSHEPSESNTAGSDETEQQTLSQSTRVPRPSTDRRQSRKQPKPKKRKDRVTKEIVKLQSSAKLLIPRLPFQRLVREVLQELKNDFRMQSSSLECLQEAAESYLTQLFEDSHLCCLHRMRQTLSEKDMRLVQILRGPSDAGRR